MHLLIPFAATASDACRHTLGHLQCPNLAALLAQLTPTEVDEGDEHSLSPPHERVLGRTLGWSGGDGLLPWAAFHAAADGVDVGTGPWGELTPVHAHVGTDRITILDPKTLNLEAAESRQFLDAVRSLFEEIGWRLAWGGATRWYTSHESLAELPTASLDRVVGNSVEAWAPQGPAARRVRGLQNEVQMLLYQSPLNDAREARGELPVNSFWLSGCGVHQPTAARADVEVAEHLRDPAVAGDWAAWAEAWQALDKGPVADLLRAVQAGEAAALTLCGERSARTYERKPRSLWQRLARRFDGADPTPILESL